MQVELLSQTVRFRVRDIYHPDPQIVMKELYGENVLEGQVLDVTQNAGGEGFAVVKVNELQSPVLIAIEHLIGLTTKKGRRA